MEHLAYFDAAAIASTVSMPDAIAAITQGFATGVVHVERTQIVASHADFLVMPAASSVAVGVKLLIVQPANRERGEPVIQGTYVLFDVERGRPIALLDGAALTSLRTPAVSAIATDRLARPDVRVLAVFGTGPQARAHVEAMRIVRPSIDQVLVVGRTAQQAASLADGLVPTARAATAAEAARSDIICTCTSSAAALFDGALVQPGTHLNLVGTYRPERREIDGALVARATVTVDDRAAARAEAGDLVLAQAEGLFDWDRVAGDLVDLAARRIGRRHPDEITIFKSSGLAHEDLVIAELVARQAGLLAGP